MTTDSAKLLLQSAEPRGFSAWLIFNVLLPLAFTIGIVMMLALQRLGIVNGFVASFWRGDLVLFSFLLVIGVAVRLHAELKTLRLGDSSTARIQRLLEEKLRRDVIYSAFLIIAFFSIYVVIKSEALDNNNMFDRQLLCAVASVASPVIAVAYSAYLQYKVSHRNVVMLLEAYRDINTRRLA